MVLRMACPTKRPGSDNWYFRKRIPADVQAILAKLPKGQRPPNWYKDQINISLKTADRSLAKARCPDVAAQVERTMATLRAGPKSLDLKQISALSGELYMGLAEALEGTSVVTAAQWSRVADVNEQVRRGDYGTVAKLSIHKSPSDRVRACIEQRFGKIADAFLVARGIVTDAESRWKLVDMASRDLTVMALRLARNADGDFTPDEYPKRFPKFTAHAAQDKAPRSLTALVQAWHKAAPDRGVKNRDADRIKSRFEKLIAFLGHDDTYRVTKQDIIRWRDDRLANKISIKTINDSDIASFSSVFNWGAERGWLADNPAERTTIKTKRKKAEVREKYFLPEEAAKILQCAAAIVGSKRESPKTTAAKRWVPWLCAYSGARVAEMIQLRKQDVRKDPSQGWVIRLTPEAGSIKNNKFCDVPVHQHLIDTGFITFVVNTKAGHLFCDPGKDGTIDGPAGGVYKRILSMVRDVVKDPHVQPNHAWRYTFKSYGLEAGIESLTLDAISNHSPRTQGEAYTKVTLRTRFAAMRKFPRYALGKSSTAAAIEHAAE
ncbi:integrase [Bradyrhizobium elkanii]|uniref:phage integrase n=1 Tax=Bradyrhizobium elkanii TaxID=29448 RepID=UPI003512C6E0